jgi:hypothetical protein
LLKLSLAAARASVEGVVGGDSPAAKAARATSKQKVAATFQPIPFGRPSIKVTIKVLLASLPEVTLKPIRRRLWCILRLMGFCGGNPIVSYAALP